MLRERHGFRNAKGDVYIDIERQREMIDLARYRSRL